MEDIGTPAAPILAATAVKLIVSKVPENSRQSMVSCTKTSFTSAKNAEGLGLRFDFFVDCTVSPRNILLGKQM